MCSASAAEPPLPKISTLLPPGKVVASRLTARSIDCGYAEFDTSVRSAATRRNRSAEAVIDSRLSDNLQRFWFVLKEAGDDVLKRGNAVGAVHPHTQLRAAVEPFRVP